MLELNKRFTKDGRILVFKGSKGNQTQVLLESNYHLLRMYLTSDELIDLKNYINQLLELKDINNDKK